MDRAPLIEFKDVTKRFGDRTVLEKVNLKIYEGDVTTLTTLCDATLALPGVHHVEGRPATGSLIISHTGSSERLIEAAAMAGAFRIEVTASASQASDQAGAWQQVLAGAMREFNSP
jgi:ABC-type phosphonate transport system ATPase subunit